MVTSTIAAPPPRGVGTPCELRAFGMSSTPLPAATLRTNWVNNADAASAEIAMSAGVCTAMLTVGVPGIDTN